MEGNRIFMICIINPEITAVDPLESTAMERFVCLQMVVTLLCGFEKKYEGNYEKRISDFTDSGNLEQWHLQIFFCFIFFFVDELQWALILFVSYLGILRMFLLLNWLFSLWIKKSVGVRLYPTWCSTLPPLFRVYPPLPWVLQLPVQLSDS